MVGYPFSNLVKWDQGKKIAELKEGWAEHSPLKYDDKTYGDRFGIQFFVENFNSHVVDNASDLVDGLRQIFDAFSLMALNSLKTENDINDLKAKAASSKTKNSKSNATTDHASLRLAVVSHFNKVLANHSKIQEFNKVFYAHFPGGKLPDCFWDLVNDAMEEEPDDSDAWIVNYYPSKSEYQKVDKVKIYFGHSIIECATKAIANIVNSLNPLWNPVPPLERVCRTCFERSSYSAIVQKRIRMLFRACANKMVIFLAPGVILRNWHMFVR